jgi:hypothetical protein
MEDPAKVLLGMTLFMSAAYSVKAIASAVVQYRLNELKAAPSELSEDRLAHIEQSIDAIAVEVERISEGQRFTTKLLSDRARSTENSAI